jgi:hypothetical protein
LFNAGLGEALWGLLTSSCGAVIISAIKGKRLKDEFEAIDLELANSLKMLGAKVVVCETSNAEESVVPMCQHIGVTTVVTLIRDRANMYRIRTRWLPRELWLEGKRKDTLPRDGTSVADGDRMERLTVKRRSQ